jgi:hypothetical protein
MAEGDLERRARKMDGFTIDERQVFARNITNADLARKDEADDEIAELQRQGAELDEKIEACEDREERLELRAQARQLAIELRDRDALLLRMYIEDERGEQFADEVLQATPFRVLRKLSVKATAYAFGVEDEENPPTTAGSASG